MAKAEPAPDDVIWWNGLRWVEAAHMQLMRFQEAFWEEHAAELDADMRLQINERDDQEAKNAFDDEKRELSQRPVRVPTWALYMQVATELDFLIVSVRNVLRAQDRLQESVRTAMSDQKAMALLRNIAEHWDEVGGRSTTELSQAFPHIEPHALAFTNKEIWIGGYEGIPVSRIQGWLYRVETALREVLGKLEPGPAPELRTSRIEGDDDLPWPVTRIRYHWSLPHVSEEEWPTEEMPDAVAEALVMRFARIRARDLKD